MNHVCEAQGAATPVDRRGFGIEAELTGGAPFGHAAGLFDDELGAIRDERGHGSVVGQTRFVHVRQVLPHVSRFLGHERRARIVHDGHIAETELVATAVAMRRARAPALVDSCRELAVSPLTTVIPAGRRFAPSLDGYIEDAQGKTVRS